MLARSLDSHVSGFTAIPRRLLDAALCSDMGKRELLLWLLVARLTYGAQGKRWVALRPADLRVIGIGSNHATEVLEGMLARDLLVKNGTEPEYCIPTADAAETGQAALSRQQWLRRLVAHQIGVISSTPPVPQNGEIAPTTPKRGVETFPKREENGSQNGNASRVPAWRFSRSQRRFVHGNGSAIDS